MGLTSAQSFLQRVHKFGSRLCSLFFPNYERFLLNIAIQ